MTLDGTRTLNSRPLLILQLPFSLLSTHSVSRLLLACCCLSHTLAQIPSPTPASEPPPSKLTLPSVLQRVLVTDRNIAVADLEVRKAVVDKLRASSRMAPRLSFDTSSNWKGDATRRTQTVSGNSAPTGPSSGTAAPVAAFVPTLVRERRWTRTQANTQSLGLNITQPILDLTVRPARRQSELLEKITQFQLQQRLREVLFNVTAQYFEVLRQEELVEETKKRSAKPSNSSAKPKGGSKPKKSLKVMCSKPASATSKPNEPSAKPKTAAISPKASSR